MMPRRRSVALAAMFVLSAVRAGGAQAPAPLTIEITSPLGRTGLSGPIRLVARVEARQGVVIGQVQFFVDGVLVGTDVTGPPFAVEWTDDNPYQRREIVAEVKDGDGRAQRSRIVLEPLEVIQSTQVSSVRLEPLVTDPKTGRSISGLSAKDFEVLEDGEVQTLDVAVPDTLPATYLFLIDSSQSMARRMDFVRDAARQLPERLRPQDQVIVAPFARALGPITGPTKDQRTIAYAIDAIEPAGGTAILDALANAAAQMAAMPGRHVIVLITDGYDENSTLGLARAVQAIKASDATVFVIAIGGVAGISLEGEALLRRIAHDTGGRAFFPAREIQLSQIHGLISDDVQVRYLLTYTPKNQILDGAWRSVLVRTSNPAHEVRVRAGYYAPAPPPIRPQIELTIRDVARKYVDIAAEDLIVLEDGKPQRVEVFQEAASAVSVALLLDASGSMRRDAEAVVIAATSFVAALPRQDKVSVMLFSDTAEFAHDLTTIRLWTQEAIAKYRANGGTALWDALTAGFDRLRKVEGRRIVVVMTDGRDENNPGTGPGSRASFDDVLTGLAESQAVVFAIGLGPNVDRARLQEIADRSGGEAYFPADVRTLGGDYGRVLENLRRRYVLSYTSTNSTHDGAWRKVEVRSKKPGVVIETTGGYFAPRPIVGGGDRQPQTTKGPASSR